MDKDSTAELAGKKVAVPLGTAAHYGFLRQMDHFGVDISTLQVVDMAPPEGAAALGQGAVDFACGYGGGLARMKEYGNVLLNRCQVPESHSRRQRGLCSGPIRCQSGDHRRAGRYGP